MRIAITDTLGSEPKFRKYVAWLQGGTVPVECQTLSYKLDNAPELRTCGGLVLTGGHDVEPSLYGGPRNHPKIKDVDSKRDQFERELIDEAFRRKVPLLAICRGCQIVNVHFGGTLIPDIEDAGYPAHRPLGDATECRHEISVEQGTALFNMTGEITGAVNSSHHQAIDRPGKGLVVTARSSDGIIEALELKHAHQMPFFLLVQWHPERISDGKSPFSKKILERFLFSIQQNTRDTHYT